MSCGGAGGRLRRLGLVVGAGLGLAAAPAPGGQWQQGPETFPDGSFAGTEADSAGQLSLSSLVGTNLAAGVMAVAGQNALSGSRSLTDGNRATEWRFNNKAEVLGEWVRLDLGGERGVTQVRILPGKTVDQRPLFYLKGYRIEVAAEDTPDDWILAAQQIDNDRPSIDTSADSTWVETGVDGQPLPVLGRYVRVKVMREDPPNWVALGEIEVYGRGYRAQGTYDSPVFDAGRPINVGTVRFVGTTPGLTGLGVQVRTSLDSMTWAPWHQVPVWNLAAGAGGVAAQEPEPARYLQARVTMETFHPLQTPTLTAMTVAYDEQLFASRLAGQIAPLRPVLGAETVFTYALDAQVAATDLGFDRVQVDLPGVVQQVRLDGLALPAAAYTATWTTGALQLRFASAYTIRADARLEIDLAAVLLAPTLAVRARVALGDAANYQNAAPAAAGWTLSGRGIVARVLPAGSVQIAPNPFNAARGSARIRVDLANLQVARPVTAAIYDLSGRRQRCLWDGEPMIAGRKLLEWDGRTDAGALVPPGHYLLRIEVDADRRGTWAGLVGVVY